MYKEKELVIRGRLELETKYYTISLIIPKTKEQVRIKLLHFNTTEKFRQSLRVVKAEKTERIFQPRDFTTHYRQTKTGEKISLNRLFLLLLDSPAIRNWELFQFPVSVKIKYTEDKQAKNFVINEIIVYFYTQHNWQGDKFIIYTNLCSNCVYFKCFPFYVNGEAKKPENFFGLARTIIKLAKPYLN